MLMSVLGASCSRAYQPTNYKKKNKKCDCSRWSQNNVENSSTISVSTNYNNYGTFLAFKIMM